MRILVIGGGIGGLCLAHGLRKAGIEVRVFEQQVRTPSLEQYNEDSLNDFRLKRLRTWPDMAFILIEMADELYDTVCRFPTGRDSNHS